MAYSLNEVNLIGNVGRDPEARYLSDGTPVANFSLATSSRRQDPNGEWVDDTEWHRIVAWERHAELAMKSIVKGSKVFVKGRIKSRKYTDDSGVQRTSFDIVVREIILLDRKPANGGDDWGDKPDSNYSRMKSDAAKGKTARGDVNFPSEEFGADDFNDVPF